VNIRSSQQILLELRRWGVEAAVVCGGARNSPLVLALAHQNEMAITSFFDERAAAFYALGLARRLKSPVAIVTTSGTAAAELLPALCEAFHSGVPLVAVTADRPPELRESGAPQSMKQKHLYGSFVECEFDLMPQEPLEIKTWSRLAPIHINVCFAEPLLSDRHELDRTLAKPMPARVPLLQSHDFRRHAQFFFEAIDPEMPTVIVVSGLESGPARQSVKSFLLSMKCPVYAESTSGLREDADLEGLLLRSGEKILEWGLRHAHFKQVIRIGAIPTARVWRDLELDGPKTKVVSLSQLPFPGLSHGTLVTASIQHTLEALASVPLTHPARELFAKDQAAALELEALIQKEPHSECAMIAQVSRLIGDNALVYLGNSLAIREWELGARRNTQTPTWASRGLNGIDGQLSTFFGLSLSTQENWALIGDLTALYDLSAPWAIRVRSEPFRTRTVIINNSGGMIFRKIFNERIFENGHNLEFDHWAKMWGLGYRRWLEVPKEISSSLAEHEIIELVPDPEASDRFWKLYDACWI
jgi:2-succinyl-5-enolpyruvyl-6-hydroxy-3-cyclohexene-1-carboxylate synthase